MIVVNCPACDAEGRVPSDKINTGLVCKKCLRTFHITPSGRAVIGEPPNTGVTAHPAEAHPHDIDHTADVDQLFEKLDKTLHRGARVAALLAVVLVGYGLYRWLQPATLDQQAVLTAMAFARNDLTTIREMALDGTSDEAVEWLDSVHPEFRDLVRRETLARPQAEILSTKQDPSQGTAEVRARIRLAESTAHRGISVVEASTTPVTDVSIDVPFVLANRGWGGWRLDGKRTIEEYRKEAEATAVSVDARQKQRSP